MAPTIGALEIEGALLMASEGIGGRLARLRQQRGLSQTEMGRKVGVTQRMVSCYETERIRIPAGMLLKIGDVLKVSVYELLGRASSGRAPKDKKLWKVIETLESLPPRDRKFILRTIETVAKAAGG